MKKLYFIWLVNLNSASIKPECSPEDNLAPNILTKSPLSPENRGTNVNKVGFVSKVDSQLSNINPANIPKNEHKTNVGVDCLRINLISSLELIAYTNNNIIKINKSKFKIRIFKDFIKILNKKYNNK